MGSGTFFIFKAAQKAALPGFGRHTIRTVTAVVILGAGQALNGHASAVLAVGSRIALKGLAGTRAIGTGVVDRATYPVVTGCIAVGGRAAGLGVAIIHSTRIPVVAIERTPTFATPVFAGIRGGAGIKVIAFRICEGMDAAVHRIAGVVCASVAILAIKGCRTLALALNTEINGRTGIAIVTSNIEIISVYAAGLSIAAVIGAKIVVVAFNCVFAGTHTCVAYIAFTTRIAVIAG
jgi:hypothetical protein